MKIESHFGTAGWCGIVVGVALFDALSPETLSQAYDRYLKSHKALAIGAVAVTGAHLCNILPEPIDPLYQTGKAVRGFVDKYI